MLTTLSQGHLSLLEACARKFQHFYIDQLSVPAKPDPQARQRWGSQFHMLMQQREMGLPIEALPPEDEEFQSCIRALVEAAPALFAPSRYSFRQSEHAQTLPFNGYLLTAVYDLLLLGDDSGKIIDWKTYLKPSTQAHLAQDWQTRLYLFLLVEATHLSPDQVSMDYWFVRCQDPETGEWSPQQISIGYSEAQHRQIAADLQRLTNHLNRFLAAGEFPQVDPSQGICQKCPFAYRCDRLPKPPHLELPSLAAVAEIPLASPPAE